MSDVVRTAVRGLGQTLITVGVVLLLFCAYELWVTNLVTAREQDRLSDELRREWAEPPARPTGSVPGSGATVPVAVELGTGIAVLRIPSIEGFDDEPPVVVEGTSVTDLKKGPGRIVGTARPGEVGNTVISGHRTTYGAPFADLDQLQPGDPVVLETRDTWFTYRVTGTEIVTPTSTEVTLPVPGRPGVEATEALLTLTTCHPKYSARQRMIVFSTLEAALPKADGLPPALQEL